MTRLDLDKLKTRFPALYKMAVVVAGQTTGICEVDLTRFRKESHKFLQECAASEQHIDLEAIEQEEQADLQRRADEAAATRRLDQYAAEQGLENTEANFALIKKFVAANTKTTYWSEQVVDLAIQSLRDQLSWKPKEMAPSPSPEPEQQEVLESWQLPIDASERMMKASTTKALQDLIKRRRAATNQQIVRGRAGEQRHGSSF